MRNKVVVFDLDDTLYNEIDFLKSAYQEIAITLSNEIFIDEKLIFNDLWSFYISGKNAFKEIINKYSIPITMHDLLIIYRNHKPNIVLTPEKKQTLDFLKLNKISIGILTDGRSIQQRNKIRALGLTTYTKDIIISEEIGSEKPSINNYKYFEDKFGEGRYYYIGDNVKKDFITPNKLGWLTICLLNNGENIHKNDHSLFGKEYLAHYDILTFREIKSLIEY